MNRKSTQKRVKSGSITDSDRLFNDISVIIYNKYIELGVELGLKAQVLRNELETGALMMQPGNKKAMEMLQRWKQSIDEDEFTYSVLAAALEKHGFVRCAHQYCYTSTICIGKITCLSIIHNVEVRVIA